MTEEAQDPKKATYTDLVVKFIGMGNRPTVSLLKWAADALQVKSGPGTFGDLRTAQAKSQKNNVEAAERASHWLWLKRGDAWRSVPLDTNWGLTTPGWINCVRVSDVRLKHPVTH